MPGADANPYLAITATLLAGWLGMEEKIAPPPKITGSAYRHPRTLPRDLEAALERLDHCDAARALLGDGFLAAFMTVKQAELEQYHQVVTTWERDHLLLRA